MGADKPRLLLIAEPSSYRIGAFLEAAKKLALEVVIASAGQYSFISEVHDGIHIDLNNQATALDIILTRARKTPFLGVLGVDDGTVELAAKVARALGFSHNPPDAALFTHRKDIARAHLSKHGCAVPKHWLIDLTQPLQAQIQEITFPCVLKPLAMSASRGVIRANDRQAFISASARIESILSQEADPFEKTHLLVEQYIDGVEIAYEGYLKDGKLKSIVIFDKPEPLVGPFFEETIYVTPTCLSKAHQAQIQKQIELACAAYGLQTGPVHAELRIDVNGAWILEVATRTIGGDCARSLDNGRDFNLEELVISLATGRNYAVSPPKEARGVMMIPIKQRGMLLRIEGLKEAQSVEHIENINMHIRPGNEMIPLPEGNQYPGFIFARANTADEVTKALRCANGHLEFIVAPILNTKIASAANAEP